MPDRPRTPPTATQRALAALARPLIRLRKFVTQRLENELRHEISLQFQRLDAQQLELGDLRERIRALEVVAAGQAPFQPQAPSAEAKPQFSIVLPTRNRAALIVDAVRSVLAQTCGSWELLIVDDGSSDATRARLQPYFDDPRVHYHATAARGVAAARNHGLALARGALIAYLDSDNAWFAGFLAGMQAEFAADATLECAYGVLLGDRVLHDDSQLLWPSFDAERLRQGNYIDLNVFVHRRELVPRHGGFDEQLSRLGDWDLILRYARPGHCRRVTVAGVHYRSRVGERISDTRSFGDNWFRIRQKLRAPIAASRAPKVLYAVWHYPQLSETYIETEIRAMRRCGVEIEVWSNDDVAVRYEPVVPVHRGTLQQAIATVRPDLLHVHWVSSAITYALEAEAAGLPLTVRGHGFEVTPDTLAQLLRSAALRCLLLFPQQRELLPQPDPRVAFVKSAFDTELFAPSPKNRRMVVRAATALASKDLRLFLLAAKRFPQHRFVLIACTAYKCESYVEELRQLKAELASPAELHFDLPHRRTAELVREAGIYLHTAVPPGAPGHTPIGMPVSIAEAMATGAYVIARDEPALREYVGDAGGLYADLDQACALIAATEAWSAEDWRAAEIRAIDRAFREHADDIVLQPLFDMWRLLLR